MWGIDPCAGASQAGRLTGTPEGSSGLPSTPCCQSGVKSVGVPIKELVSAPFY